MTPQAHILVAEDNPDYGFFLDRILQTIEFTRSVTIVYDGSEVLNHLSGIGRYADRSTYPYPDVIFTDLKMPCVSGFDVLRWLQNHSEHTVPRIVLSSSADEKDIMFAYELGASAFLIKPPELLEMQKMLHSVLQFWTPARDLQLA